MEHSEHLKSMIAIRDILIASTDSINNAIKMVHGDDIPETVDRKLRAEDYIQNAVWQTNGIEKSIQALILKMRPELTTAL